MTSHNSPASHSPTTHERTRMTTTPQRIQLRHTRGWRKPDKDDLGGSQCPRVVPDFVPNPFRGGAC
jgi:hypothetical protein